MQSIFEHLKANTSSILSDIETLVRLESPSTDAARINAVQDMLQSWLAPLGEIKRTPHELGDILHCRIAGKTDKRAVLLAHADTVYGVGAWKTGLWRIEGDQAFGPGSYDMKAGIVQALWAIRTLKTLKLEPSCTIDFLITPDEEIASHAGKPHIEALATGASAVLVLEPPHLNGDLKVARKGVGTYTVKVHGKAAHQGTEPENGRNAIVSAAHFITELVKLQNTDLGTTLGPNIIQGGSASNVVADEVTIDVDIRVWTQAEASRIDHEIRQIQALEGTTYEISDGLNRPAMEPSEGTWVLLEKAQRIAKEVGLNPGAARVGGGSDGNFTAKLSPTLDGFGAFGKNAHQKDLEFIVISELAPRTAMLAGLLLEI